MLDDAASLAETKSQQPVLVGSTPAELDVNDATKHVNSQHSTEDSCSPGLFKSAQWSPDGTTILASRENNTLESYILPPDLLQGAAPHVLTPYSSYKTPSPVYATAIYPSYELSEPSSTLFLASLASLPIRLLSPFSVDIVASYPLINASTEAYIAPNSLVFGSSIRSRDTFFAGSDCQISVFNIHRDGEGPVEEKRTIPSRRKKLVGGGVGMKGIVSAMHMSSEGILAAGTFTRWIGLYDGEGRGDTVGVFQLGREVRDPPRVGNGAGLTQVSWSTCGRYLCTAERMSDGMGIWDIRGTGKRLAWLSGRKARTMQRLGFDIVGEDAWAGGIDGKVRLWKHLGTKEGLIEPDWEFEGHEDAISSTAMHSCGSVLATCCGQRHISPKMPWLDSHSDSGDSADGKTCVSSLGSKVEIESHPFDNSLKIWML